ncbi:MAG: tetratricopeptide repeat protein [Clostridia bacterium]
MSYKEIIKGFEKIDIGKTMSSKIKPSQDLLMAYEIYNNALDSIRYGNEDIAVIKLKKVVSVFPEFEQAVLLLKKVKEYEKARMGEYNLADGSRPPPRTPVVPKKKTLPEKLGVSPRLLMKIILWAVMAILAVILFLAVYNLANRNSEEPPPGEQGIRYTQEDMNALNEQIIRLESTIQGMNLEIKELEQAMESEMESRNTLQETIDYLASTKSLFMAGSYYYQGDFTNAVNALAGVDAGLLSDVETGMYGEIRLKAYGEAAKSLYLVALNLYNQMDYAGALENFQKVLQYDPDFREKGQCLYNIGRAYYELDQYQEALDTYINLEKNVPSYSNTVGIMYHSAKAYASLGDKQKAIGLFTRVINEYPGSSLVGYARERLNILLQD